jgi:EpsI family protein
MFGNTGIRISIVVTMILLVYGGSKLANLATTPPDVELPTWKFDELPAQLGDWTGMKPTKLDENLAAATDAKFVYNRTYRDKLDHAVLLHTAIIENPSLGICHNPQICYPYNGWTNKIKEFQPLTFPVGKAEKTISVYTGLFTNDKGERVWVIYWYQIGPHVVYDRTDIGFKVRRALAGQKKWPALIKVMLQIDVSETENARGKAMELAALVAQWMNMPEHNLGL